LSRIAAATEATPSELAAASRLSNTASEVDEPDMQLALLRLDGPRLQAAMTGSILLSVWLDFLNLTDVVLEQCPYYNVEKLLVDLDRLQKMLEHCPGYRQLLPPRSAWVSWWDPTA
jgi:hypothetical protein